MRRAIAARAIAALVLSSLATLALAQPISPQDNLVTPPPAAFQEGGTEWQREKCRRYAQAWTDILQRRGKSGLSPAFIERQDAFIASGCLGIRNVCPRSPTDFEVANILVILGMNARLASTFFPFSCRAG